MPRARGALVWPLSAALALLASLHTGVASSRTGIPGGFPQDKGTENAKTPPLYDTIRDAKLVHAGQILDGSFRLDRFELKLTDGHLYLAPQTNGVVTTVVFLGNGLIRGYPPDAVEHHQLKKLSDRHHVEETFDRLLIWSAGDVSNQMRALATPTDERDTDRANRLLESRREARLHQQLDNPDSRVLNDLLRRQAETLHSEGTYLAVELDTKDHGWLTVEVEPNQHEEVRLYRYDRRGQVTDTWMNVHQLFDFAPDDQDAALDGFPVDPDSLDEDDATGAALGLPLRPIVSPTDGRPAQATVSRTQVDLALENNGDAAGTAALLVEPLEPTRGLRLRISPTLGVTDVRWRPDHTNGSLNSALLVAPDTLDGRDTAPDAPTSLSGAPLHFVQERYDRLMDDDLFEPWVTVALPHTVGRGDQFILELAYEGELIERQRQTLDFLLKDTIFWYPKHPDTLSSRLDLTFRVPERYRIASAGTLTDERVVDETRIVRWVTDGPVRSMAFHYGEFEVTTTELPDGPAISVYGNDNHLGFRPGAHEKTISDLTDSIRLFSEYFGPFPYDSLLVTETATQSGQAFPGLVLLSYQAFGELFTGEAELFRAHEVAHQWWGAGINWTSYRDQWMTEGFAHYAAALYALHALDNPDQFDDMINAWRLDVLGEGQVGQGLGLRHYGFRPEVLRRSDAHKSGALVVGYRLNSRETPFDYRLLAYEKGAYVLHMLRSMLLDPNTGDDQRFKAMMRRYATEHVGNVMSTRSFEATVTETFGEPMDWFFDQWVYGVEVPTYRPNFETSAVVDAPLPFLLHGTVRQENVSEGFRMPVPVRVTFDDDSTATHQVWIDAEEVTVEIPLQAQPTRVEFNHGRAVLAKVR